MSIFGFQRCPPFVHLLLVGIVLGWRPAARAQEPRWFQLNGLPEASLGLEMDGSIEKNQVNGVESGYNHSFITPLVGLRANGSIYHPNLLTFNLDGALGWGWDTVTAKGPGYSQTTKQNQELTRYLAQVNLLTAKPYNAMLYAAQDQSFQDYSTFSTYWVENTRYGGRLVWNTETLKLSADLGYRDETTTGLNDTSEISETFCNFLGQHQREYGQTTLIGRINQYDNIPSRGNSLSSVNESVSVSDSETFGQRRQITSTTGASYSQSSYRYSWGRPQETIAANENLSINHRPNLDSYLLVDFNHNEVNPVTVSRLQGTYGLRHQLYDSLSSTLGAHGWLQDSEVALVPPVSANSDLYGVGLMENYTKRLGSWGQLSAGLGVIADHEDDSSSGGNLIAIDEPHQLYLPTSINYRPAYLNRPRVIATSIRVNVPGDVLVSGSDYQAIPRGELTEIQLVLPPSSHLQSLLQTNDNLAVTVTYQSASVVNASYEIVNTSAQIRLDLFGKFGVYARMNWVENNAPPTVLVQSLTDLVGGVDYHWRWLRVGAEYENYDSNFSQFQSWRFFQNLDFQLDDKSSLSFVSNQTFYRYGNNSTQTQYQFLSRYNVQLLASLAWYVEGGGAMLEVLGTEQLQGMARTGISWTRGKLSARAGYEFNSQATSGQSAQDQMGNRIFVYLKRTF